MLITFFKHQFTNYDLLSEKKLDSKVNYFVRNLSTLWAGYDKNSRPRLVQNVRLYFHKKNKC